MPSGACESLRKALAACERATSGRCAETAKSCDALREKWKTCEKSETRVEPPPPPTPPPVAPPAAAAAAGWNSEPLKMIDTATHPSECGSHHCVALVERLGIAASWATAEGSKGKKATRFGQLGWGAAEEKSGWAANEPRAVRLPAHAGRVVSVAAGDLHTAIVDEHGGLWCCGSDRWLQLGQDAFWSKGHTWQREPSLVTSLKRNSVRIVAAACGADHTLALDDTGVVYAFGYGEHGQCHGKSQRTFTSPPTVSAVLSEDGGATQIWASGHCSCALRPGGLWKCVGKCKDVWKE